MAGRLLGLIRADEYGYVDPDPEGTFAPSSIQAHVEEAFRPMKQMDKHEYRRVLERLSLWDSQGKLAGKFLGKSPRQCQNYALGAYPVPKHIAMLLRVMVVRRLKPAWVQDLTTDL